MNTYHSPQEAYHRSKEGGSQCTQGYPIANQDVARVEGYPRVELKCGKVIRTFGGLLSNPARRLEIALGEQYVKRG